ncbi:MAG TPA: FAD-dependent monooxygenase [Planctomycetaceae bacterium]
MAVDFLIVGAGIGGAVLANLLSRAGKRVLVLERDANPPQIVRPEILWPATVRYLESIVSGGRLPETAVMPLRSLEFEYKQSTLFRISTEFFDRVGVELWSSDGDRTRSLLLREAQCDVERGVEVVGLLKEAGRVVGVRARSAVGGTDREIAARWTIGDDGGHSVVRRECGIAMSVRSLPIDLLSFGFPLPQFMEPGMGKAWINPHRGRSGMFLLAGLSRPSGTAAGLIAVRPRLFQNDRDVQHALDEFSACVPQVAQVLGTRRYPSDLAHVRLSWGHAARYGTDGALLIGDAAHAVTPAGGQGANMAIADARIVAEAALSGESQLVEEYERRRRPANARSMQLSRRATTVASLPNWILAPAIPTAFRILNRCPRLFARGLRFTSTAFLESTDR